MKRSFTPLLLLLSMLNIRAQTPAQIENIAFFLQDGVEILDFAGPMEVFISAGFNVYTVAESKTPLKAMGKLTILPDYSLADCPEPDMIAFFGGGRAASVSQKPEVRDWVNGIIPKTDVQFSVCTGAYFLGEAGLLDGRTATTFHSAIPYLQERFPKAIVRDDVRFVDNGTVITTAGISAGIDGALHMVAKLKGREQAVQVAENMEYFGWEPEKGLVLESGLVKNIREQGLQKALKTTGKNSLIFPGEIMNLGQEFAAAGKKEKAAEVYEYALDKFELTEADCENIRTAFVAAGKAAPPSRQSVVDIIRNGQYAEATEIILQAKKEFPRWVFFPESTLNSYGYRLLAKNELDQAIAIFKMNVKIYPASFNPYDSLGEAYMMAEQWDLAVENYKKSLELNPDNENGRLMLEKIAVLRKGGKDRR